MRRERHRYELRLGNATIQRGLFAEIGGFQVGDRLNLPAAAGIIRAFKHEHGEEQPVVVLELLPRGV